jgi:hypothetical protein
MLSGWSAKGDETLTGTGTMSPPDPKATHALLSPTGGSVYFREVGIATAALGVEVPAGLGPFRFTGDMTKASFFVAGTGCFVQYYA